MDDQRDGNYLWEKIGHSQEILIKYKKLINRLKEASVFCKGGQIQFNKIGNCEEGGKSSLIKLEIARKENGQDQEHFVETLEVWNPTSQSIQYEILWRKKT